MIDAILAFSIRQRWLVMMAVFAIAAFGAWNFTRLPIDAVPDITNVQVQINSTARGLFAAGSRAAHHLPDRDRDGRAAEPRIHALAVALRAEPGDRRLQGRHRHLFRAPARQRAHPAGQGSVADRHPDRDGSDLDRARRNLHVRGRSKTRCAQRQGRALQLDRSADDPGLDHQAAAAHRAGRCRGQLDRRLREAVPCASQPDAADGLSSCPSAT